MPSMRSLSCNENSARSTTPTSRRWLWAGLSILTRECVDWLTAGLMDGMKAALVATDPPYLVDYTGERPTSAKRRTDAKGKSKGTNDGGKDWSATYREIDIADAQGFLRSVFTRVLEVLAPHAALYCWHAHKRQALITRIWEELGILDHQQIVWVKPTAVFGRVFWHFRHEPCMMGWRQGSMPGFDSDHRFDSVWEINWEGKNRVVGNEHPTQKPVEIFARPIRKHTKPGEVVFEPFSGSGSQLIAAEQLGRRCRAIELEPVFVDVAIRRWQKLTGKAATLAGTKDAWARVAADRGVPTEEPVEQAAEVGGKVTTRAGAAGESEVGQAHDAKRDPDVETAVKKPARKPQRGAASDSRGRVKKPTAAKPRASKGSG